MTQLHPHIVAFILHCNHLDSAWLHIFAPVPPVIIKITPTHQFEETE